MANTSERPGNGLPAFFTRYRDLFATVLLAAFALVIYSNTFGSSFQFDDNLYVIDNNLKYGLSSFWPPYGARYFGYLSFALNYHFGGLEVFGYHLVNVAIHIANGALFYFLVKGLFNAPWFRRHDTRPESVYALAFLASILFISHPIQTESITYVTQRFASLATLFYLASLVAYLYSRTGGKRWLYFVSVLSAVMAQMTKEISFTLPFVVIFFELMFFDGTFMQKAKRFAPFALTLVIIPFMIFGPELGLGFRDVIGEYIRSLQLVDIDTVSRYDYMITEFRVIVTYIRLLFFPIGQNLDYDYPMSHSFLEPQVFLSFVFLSTVFFSALYILISSYRKGNIYLTLAGAGVLWFFLALSIESTVIPIKDIIFEHRLYLPSIGASLAFSSAALYLFESLKKRYAFGISTVTAAFVITAFMALPLGAATYMRNSVWENEVTLYEDILKKSPNKERVRYNLAWAYHKRGEKDKAVVSYYEDLKLEPNKDRAHYNLALIFQEKGEREKAIFHYAETLRIKPDNVDAYYNLATLYHEKNDTDSAIRCLLSALNLKPAFENAHYNIAWMYQEKGEYESALVHYAEVVKLNPKSFDAYYNAGMIRLKQGLPEIALKEFTSAVQINPGYQPARAELEKLTGKKM